MVVTGIAMIFAVYTIILDEKNRHIDFAKQVEKDEHKLMDTLGCSKADVERFRTDFEAKETAKAMTKEEMEIEREKLAEIN